MLSRQGNVNSHRRRFFLRCHVRTQLATLSRCATTLSPNLSLAHDADLNLDPLPDHLEAFVRETCLLPAPHDDSGLRVDFIFSTTAYEREAIGRARRIE